MKTIFENIQQLAMHRMTEDGIHHDDYPDHEHIYIDRIIEELKGMNE